MVAHVHPGGCWLEHCCGFLGQSWPVGSGRSEHRLLLRVVVPMVPPGWLCSLGLLFTSRTYISSPAPGRPFTFNLKIGHDLLMVFSLLRSHLCYRSCDLRLLGGCICLEVNELCSLFSPYSIYKLYFKDTML